jgi:putative DNA primase/helicase
LKLTINEAKQHIDLPAYIAGRWHESGARPGKPGTIKAAWRDEQDGSLDLWREGDTWLWKDHATGETGSIVDLLMAADRLSKREAIARVLELAGATHAPGPATRALKPDGWDGWELAEPMPIEAAPAHTFQMPKIGKLGGVWRYFLADGRLAFVVARYDKPDGSKDVRPWTVWRGPDGALKWRMKGYPAPRPLYQLPLLSVAPIAPVLVVEGERTADAAGALFPGYVVLTWPGGAQGVKHAAWSPLAGRDVVIWPDADLPGVDAAADVAAACARVGAASVRVVPLPAGLPKGWDLADPLPEGMDPAELMAAAPAWVPDDGGGDRPAVAADDMGDYTLEDETPDEMGTAIRFARLHRGRVRYSPGLGWLVWDGTRYVADTGRVQELVTRQIRDLRAGAGKLRIEAAELRAKADLLMNGDDDDQAEFKRLCGEAKKLDAKAGAMVKAAKDLGTSSRIRGIMSQATSKPGIHATASDFDRDPWLFNARNGIVDMRTGGLLPHDPAAMMTRIGAVSFVPGAAAPTWEQFIRDAFGGDEDLIRFVRQVVGYSLTGDTSEQRFFILEGTGGNGKGVFLDTVITLMGDYARTVAKEAITLRSNGDTQGSADIADLPGARLASINELGDGDRLNVNRIKELTGGETISARALYQQPINYQPAFKLWIRTNHLPEAKIDQGLADRIVRVPFLVRFRGTPLEDKGLKAKLMAELPGVLNWAIAGARDWLANGLLVPQAVTEATAAYVADQDPIGRWIDQMELRPVMEASRLHEAYDAWRKAEGAEEMSKDRLGKALTARGWGNPRSAMQVRPGGPRVRVRIPPADLLATQPVHLSQPVPAKIVALPGLVQADTGRTGFPQRIENRENRVSHEGGFRGNAVPTRPTCTNGTGSAFAESAFEEGEL